MNLVSFRNFLRLVNCCLSEHPSRAGCFRKLGRDGYTAELKANGTKREEALSINKQTTVFPRGTILTTSVKQKRPSPGMKRPSAHRA